MMLRAKPKRAVLIGLDGANYEAMKPLISKGRLPNLARLIQDGTLCVNALATYPTLTGSNWATIATGAWPGTHGVTDMSYHVTGEPLNHWHSGFTSDAVEAETIWEVVAKTGKKAVVLKYTGSWPPRHPDIVMVDGGGGRPFWGGSFLDISHSHIFSTIEYPNGNIIKINKANGWKNIPNSKIIPLETIIDFIPVSGNVPEFLRFQSETLRKGKIRRFFLLIMAGSSNYDRVYFCSNRDARDAIAIVKSGEWSPSFYCEFEVNGKLVRGGMRFKVLEISPRGDTLSIYFSQVYPTDKFSQPSHVGATLVEKFGAHTEHTGYSEYGMGWFHNSPETFLEVIEYQNQWLGKAGRYLLETTRCDFLAMQCHNIDFANHAFIPRHGWDKKTKDKKLALLDRCYESVDRMVGDLVRGAGKEAIICVVSDHGATDNIYSEVFINPILNEAGLLVYEDKTAETGFRRPDYKKSVAVSERASNIYINLRGREPWGVVPSKEYEFVRDKIIDALLKWRHPETGQNPFSMVMRKEDARILGLFDSLGRDIGDIVYALHPEYDHEHGRQLPTVTLDRGSMKPLLVFSGPGVKKRFLLQRTVWLTDVAPTIASAMNWRIPTEAEGAVLYQMFSGHKTVFPRPEFLKRQAEYKDAIRKILKAEDEKKLRQSVNRETSLAQTKVTVKERMPKTLKEMREEIKRARAEARRWKNAYEQYHRITHGN